MIISFLLLFGQWLPNSGKYYSHWKCLRNTQMRETPHDQDEGPVIRELGGHERMVLPIFLLTWLKTSLEPPSLPVNHAQTTWGH